MVIYHFLRPADTLLILITLTEADSYLIELFGHLADDLCVLHVPEHLDPHSACVLQDNNDMILIRFTFVTAVV